jgi:8-oxo-dGTP pyrophosphatase MutT (NUDIX family)
MLDIDPLRDGPTPVPAATVVLIRDSARGLEVFLLQRHKATAFMGGAYVFPGGKLDPEDASEDLRPYLSGPGDEPLLAALGEAETIDPANARALHVAAARETFEEAGVLLGTATGPLPEARARLNAKEPLAAVLASVGATLDLSRLVPLSRWITPAVERRRFDARFFLAAVAASELASADVKETVAELWATADEAIEHHLAGRIDLPPPTLRTLELLAPHGTADAALEAARRQRPPLVRPVFHAPESGWVLTLPGDPEHPEARPVLGGSTRFVCREGRWFSR